MQLFALWLCSALHQEVDTIPHLLYLDSLWLRLTDKMQQQ